MGSTWLDQLMQPDSWGVWSPRQRRSPGSLGHPCSAVFSLGWPSRTDAGRLIGWLAADYHTRIPAPFATNTMKLSNTYWWVVSLLNRSGIGWGASRAGQISSPKMERASVNGAFDKIVAQLIASPLMLNACLGCGFFGSTGT